MDDHALPEIFLAVTVALFIPLILVSTWQDNVGRENADKVAIQRASANTCVKEKIYVALNRRSYPITNAELAQFKRSCEVELAEQKQEIELAQVIQMQKEALK